MQEPKTYHQTTDTLLMVRPARFGFNEETALNNVFQQRQTDLSDEEIQEKAVREFDDFVSKLREKGIEVIVADDNDTPVTPDAVFPNNWITFHEDGCVVTYPMFSEIRREERREEIIEQFFDQFPFEERVHLEQYETRDRFLEGTGSMILDRINRIVYACLSPRTDIGLLNEFCDQFDYEKIVFNAVDDEQVEIYHTNVMMALGEDIVVVCLDTVRDDKERNALVAKLRETGKALIEITISQMKAFAGNMLQVRNKEGETFLVMSEQAFQSLNEDQVEKIEAHTKILSSPIPTIEALGGGSTRCMMAEVFYPGLS